MNVAVVVEVLAWLPPDVRMTLVWRLRPDVVAEYLRLIGPQIR